MKRIIVFTILIALIGCQSEKSDKIQVSGKLENPVSDSLVLRNSITHKTIIRFDVDAKGNFNKEIKVKEGIYYLFDGRDYFNVYLEKGTNLHIESDGNDLSKHVIFSKDGGVASSYIKAKNEIQEKEIANLETYFSLPEVDFLSKTNEFKEKLHKNYEKYSGDLSDTFKAFESKSLNYNQYNLLNTYIMANKSNEEFKVSDSYLDYLKKIDFNDDFLYQNSAEYRNFLVQYMINESLEIESESIHTTAQSFINILNKKVNNSIIKDDILTLIGKSSLLVSENQDLDKTYALIVANLTSKKNKEEVKKAYNEIQPANIKGEDVKGNTVSLSDFKGSVIYIDFWATWCGPCLSQIPYLKQLEEEFKDANIKFVSISMDRKGQKNKTWKDANQKWKNMLKNKDLHGIQLFAGEKNNALLNQQYKIRSIPRFMLIGPDGTLINDNAPRPSSQEIRTLLESYK